MARCIVLAAILALPAVSLAQEKLDGPHGCPPNVVMARAVRTDDGKIELRLQVPRSVTEERMERKIVDGKPVEVRTVTYRSVMVTRTYVADGKKVVVSRKSGLTVEPRNLPTLLDRPTAALLFCGKADPYYLQVIREDVYIITVPEDHPSGGITPIAPKSFPKEPPRKVPTGAKEDKT